ncbi:MAG: hypothetical protein HRT61_22715, partial [Ekhidna sp.]|nr:hypothetical protein [Ekhidna sp.]
MRSFLFTLAICLVVLAKAQSVSTFFDALSHFEEKAEITFSYDAELRDLIQTDQKFSVVDLASFVDEVNSKLPIEINQVAEGYLSIVVVPSDFEMIVKDSLDYSMIGVDFGVQVIVNDAPITTKFKEGSWYFNYKPALDDQVSVFSQGYKKAKIEVSDLFESKAFEIYLSLPTRRLNTVVVEDYLTSGIDLLPSRQSVKIDVQ